MDLRKHLIRRVYHPHWLWEESYTNMWGSVSSEDRERLLEFSIEFAGDARRYGAAMLKVTQDWPYSCEHNLTNLTQNRRAWIGHAACALEYNCPEDIVRSAWGRLSEFQQVAANKVADEAIESWEREYAKTKAGYVSFGSCEKSYSLDF